MLISIDFSQYLTNVSEINLLYYILRILVRNVANDVFLWPKTLTGSYPVMQVFFTKFLVGGGTCFRGRFSVPVRNRVRWGDHTSGTESDEGDLKKLSTAAKNAPYSKIRANFGVLTLTSLPPPSKLRRIICVLGSIGLFSRVSCRVVCQTCKIWVDNATTTITEWCQSWNLEFSKCSYNLLGHKIISFYFIGNKIGVRVIILEVFILVKIFLKSILKTFFQSQHFLVFIIH